MGGDYTNVTNIGLYLIDIVAARELDLIGQTRAQARRAEPDAGHAERLETNLVFFNHYDTTSLERKQPFHFLRRFGGEN